MDAHAQEDRQDLGPPLLLTDKAAAALLSLSRSGFQKLHSQGRVPLPMRLSEKAVRWRRLELEAWTRAGCPPRDNWDPQTFKRTA